MILSRTFFNFSRRFFCPFPCEPLPLFCCFCSCMSPWQLDYLTKDIHSCQRFFLSFFDFFPALFSTPVSMPVSGAIVPLPARSNLHSKACFVTSWSTGSFVRIRSPQAQNQVPGLPHSYTSWKKRTETVLFLKFISDLPTIAQEKLFVARRQGCEPRSVLIVREKRTFRRQQRHGQF